MLNCKLRAVAQHHFVYSAALLVAVLLAQSAAAQHSAWAEQHTATALSAARLHYQPLAAAAWPQLPPGAALQPGTTDPRVATLRRRLIATGDLDAMAAIGDTYDATLEQAVRLFQYRHGLQIDSVVGPATRRALNVSASERLATIDANLIRWRSLSGQVPKRYLSVNIAAAELALVEDREPIFHSRVIVGSPAHPTPEFASQVKAVVINPPWNVPRSIAVNEILPQLRERNDALVTKRMIIVGRNNDPHGLNIDWNSVTSSDFSYLLRQLPGSNNALGRIKLDFPNPYSVYLHDTAEPSLFERTQRTLSHGCVRLAQPRELAQRLLADQGWSTVDIDLAVAAGETLRLPLSTPLPIYLRYWTAFVDASGYVHFRDDVYQRDRRQLTQAPCAPQQPTTG